MNVHQRIEASAKKAAEIARARMEALSKEFQGKPAGQVRATDEEIAQLIERRVVGELETDENGIPLMDVDPMTGEPTLRYVVPPDPLFLLALVATHKGKPIVKGGTDLLARYERDRGLR